MVCAALCPRNLFSLKFFTIYLPVLLTTFYALDKYLLPKLYIFDPIKLQQLSQQSIDLYGESGTQGFNTSLLFQDLVLRLQDEYGKKHIQSLKEDDWFFNNAGGAMGAMIILHASISEYLILFGTPLGTEGHSGIHLADDYFTILAGEQGIFMPGIFEPHIFKPGMQNWMKRGDGTQYVLKGWALELAQGWIPSMLPFGFLDTFTSTLDFGTLWKTCYLTGKNIVAQMLVGKF